jgi:hypothetical protein
MRDSCGWGRQRLTRRNSAEAACMLSWSGRLTQRVESICNQALVNVSPCSATPGSSWARMPLTAPSLHRPTPPRTAPEHPLLVVAPPPRKLRHRQAATPPLPNQLVACRFRPQFLAHAAIVELQTPGGRVGSGGRAPRRGDPTRGMSSSEAANAFAPELAPITRRVSPKARHDRPTLTGPTDVLDEIFAWQETRKPSQSLSFKRKRRTRSNHSVSDELRQVSSRKTKSVGELAWQSAQYAD